MWKMMLCCCLVLLAACAGRNPAGHGGGAGAAGSGPQVHIYPLTTVPASLRLGVLPFRLPANVATGKGGGVAAMFKDVLMRKRAFRVVRQLDGVWGSIDEALLLGRRAGVDLVLAGELVHAMEGTELGGARVAVAVRVINVHSGHTFWYLEQSADQGLDYPRGDMLSRTKAAVGPPKVRDSQRAPVLPAMLAGIAEEMAGIIAAGQYVPSL